MFSFLSRLLPWLFSGKSPKFARFNGELVQVEKFCKINGVDYCQIRFRDGTASYVKTSAVQAN